MQNIIKKIFFIEKNPRHIIVHFFTFKLSFKNKKTTKKAIKIQNSYDLTDLQNTEKIVLFLVPNLSMISGGLMSIYSMCEYSRNICKDSFCLISTHPGDYTYAVNDKFKNNEKIYRWEQITKNAKNVKEMILHIPEYYSQEFYSDLGESDIKFLKSIKKLHINIMNQNIELMPEPEGIKNLYELTSQITQTTAHHRYAKQEICDKWTIPMHFFSVYIDYSKYKQYSFDEKEKIIVLSPDSNDFKENIVDKLQRELPDFKLITVQDMTFSEYMDLISKAYFTITFGEGMDGYFCAPHFVNSVGITVYNDNFFPDSSWLNLKNVYSDYNDLLSNLVSDINFLISSPEDYQKIIQEYCYRMMELYSLEKFKDNLERFYKKEYDFFPGGSK